MMITVDMNYGFAADHFIGAMSRLLHFRGAKLNTLKDLDRYFGLEPDLMTVAKGLTSAYLPLSGAMVGKRVWEVLEQGSEAHGPFSHGSS